MLTPSFSEDMLPRHFPKTKDQLQLKAAAPPMPTLPGLSLLLSDDNKVFKPEPIRKVEPKKSFEQWKQQHHGIFTGNDEMYQRKPEKKQVRFETNKPNGQSSNQRILSPVVPNFEQTNVKYQMEESFHERSDEPNFCQNQRPNYHQHNSKVIGHDKNILLTKCNHKPTSPSFATDKAYNAANQVLNESPHFTRTVRAESMKENCFSAPVQNDHRQCHGNCCQTNHNNWEMTNYQTCDHAMPNGYVGQRRVQQSNRHDVQSNDFSPLIAHNERNLKDRVPDDMLLGIMEEQQEHILLQQNQIMMQQKQNMMQQQQIFMLQRQVQKLLHRNGNNPIESPHKLYPTSICDNPTTPRTMTNALQNATKTRSGEIDSVCNGAKTSIGVMTSFLGNVNDGVPNGMQQLNERFTSKLTNEKFVENMGGFSAEEYSDNKDSMLARINDAIKNSSALIDYRSNKAVHDDGSSSPKPQADINIAAQALFYETSSINGGCLNEQTTSDRSIALYMLGMKYDCVQDGSAKKVEQRDWQPQQTNGKNGQVPVNLSPEVYDYLKRHGLLKQE